ncbi:mutator protein MutT [Povalibacter uvarum]|uniref:8-oxo-dGTP diphosphatase n=1 Tax=Povalibacter uvarum TaxID=732238 RepID=A0A841HP42_9GAMM|nr:8-oxo-dGTP diphosphatase MutT [Povalibacter uvarum]MBB6094907.1 mutator protein MutT [Povalibacter uvarum]
MADRPDRTTRPPPRFTRLLRMIVQRPPAHVLAGAIFDEQGRVLIAQRPPGKHLAGGWEFPGGKLEPGEERIEALQRELDEELGITVHSAEPLICYEHHYPDRRVVLDLWLVTKYTGTPQSLEGQPLQWVAVNDLEKAGLLDADKPMIPALQRVEGWALGCKM